MSFKDCIQKYTSRFYHFLSKQDRYYRFKRNVRQGHLVMGEHSYGMPDVHVYKGSEAKVVIGKYCSIAPDVTFITGGIHPVDWVSTYPFRANFGLPGAGLDGTPATKGDISVGNDVWIGTHVYVLSGVTVGDGAVICAGSIVLNDVPPFAIAGGVPAKVIKSRFSEESVRELLEIRWWEWDEKKIIENVEYLSSPRIEEFISKWKER